MAAHSNDLLDAIDGINDVHKANAAIIDLLLQSGRASPTEDCLYQVSAGNLAHLCSLVHEAMDRKIKEVEHACLGGRIRAVK